MAKKPSKPEYDSVLTDELGRPIADDKPKSEPGYNAADPKQIEAAKKEEGQRRRQDRDFFQHCMGSPERRASFYRILEKCHIYATPVDLGDDRRGADTHFTYFKLGQENIGKQMMLAAMDASLDLYLRMVKEQKEARDAKERKDG